jgi:hypothetical protein
MPNWPLAPSLYNRFVIGTISPESDYAPTMASLGLTFGVSNAWPSANLAIFVPVDIFRPVTIVKMMVNNGSAVSGNIDVGIYTPNGARLVSAGSTAQAGTSAIQTFDITDTLLMPGWYYMAVALDNTTGTLAAFTGGTAVDYRPLGMAQMASAFALPDPATFAAFTQTYVPLVSMTQRTTV